MRTSKNGADWHHKPDSRNEHGVTQILWEPGLLAKESTRPTCRTALSESRASPNASLLSERYFECREKPVGAWLASDADDAVSLSDRVDSFAGKPTPTRGLVFSNQA